ncbi:MAG: YcxB family protein [Ruminococcus sp.]|nr:YcxB family protein [Ruminococcus sp.]
MMNPKFLNRFIRTFEVEQELYRYMNLTSPLNLAALIILATVLIIDVAASIILGLNYANMAVFAMCIILLFVLFFRYFSAIQKGKARFAEDTNNKGEVTVTTTVTEGKLISETSDRETPVEVPFEKFKKIFETKHYYMLYTDEKMVYVLKKGAFEKGREEEFLPYIRNQIENNKSRRT